MKYKLIKKYPGSVELGTIVERDSNCSNYYYRLIDGVSNTFTPKNIENNPEFWEEIVEKNYEILSYIHNGSKHIWKKDSQFETYFYINQGLCPCTRLEDILKYPKIYLIHSIKKLSDGEIFTIGDDVLGKTCGVPDKILSIEIINNKIRLYPRNSFYNLEDIKKIKQPLFTTEDGVDIFENNTAIFITDNFTVRYIKHKDFNAISKHVKYFSSKEKAEEYILLNKPCLSYNEVLNAVKIKNKNTFETLKNIVKSKIQQSV